MDGSFAPGAADAIQVFRCAAILELLSLFMRVNSSATPPGRTVVLEPQTSGLWLGLASGWGRGTRLVEGFFCVGAATQGPDKNERKG